MIPFAELINHENSDVQYDYLNGEGKSITLRREQKLKEEHDQKLLQILKKNQFFEELKKDLIKLEEEMKQKLKDMGKEVPENF